MATVHEGLQELAYGDVTLLEVQRNHARAYFRNFD